jgi:uncharacterized membrane protein YeaQ/YmgE (transglycosylase-associated protein family)
VVTANATVGGIMNVVFLLIGLLVAWIVFSLVVFPLLVMTIFAVGALFPYIIGAVALYLLWKFLKKRA